jgi:hypothetical protein
MNERKVLKPAQGVKVRKPETGQHLAEGGEEVTVSSYWLRRLAAGDVVEVVAAKAGTGTSAKAGTQGKRE